MNSTVAGVCGLLPSALEHDPENCAAVFRKHRAQSKTKACCRDRRREIACNLRSRPRAEGAVAWRQVTHTRGGTGRPPALKSHTKAEIRREPNKQCNFSFQIVAILFQTCVWRGVKMTVAGFHVPTSLAGKLAARQQRGASKMASVVLAKLQAVPRHARALFARKSQVPTVRTAPDSPLAWIALAERRLSTLTSQTRNLITNHELGDKNHVMVVFESEIRAAAGPRLKELARDCDDPAVIAEAIEEIIKRKTIIQCAHAHREGGYFSDAEGVMSVQWENVIWPIIKDENFERTLDLACGHGRNTNFLRNYAASIDLVDVNTTCIDACRARFGTELDGCRFRYHVTDGNGLPGIADASLTFVYSWDSMVHFDKAVVRDYVREIRRVLVPGGSAFLHHSNFGAFAPDSDWANNHGSRSDMTAQLMRDFAAEAGLSVRFQRLRGRADGWGMDDLDCLSLLKKPD